MRNSKIFRRLPPLWKRTEIRAVLAVIFAGYFVLMTVPWVPDGFYYGIDESFKIALNEAIRLNLQFGKDFVYTYGPHGFLLYPKYFPDTYRYLLIGRGFMGLCIGLGLLKVFVHCWRTCRPSVLFLLPFLLFCQNVAMSPDSLLMVAIALPLLVYFYIDKGRPSPTLIILVIGLAFMGLIKQTALVLGFAFVLLISIDQSLRRKRLPLMLLVYLGGLLLFWLLAGQNLANIGLYLTGAYQIVKGFSATMGWQDGSVAEVVLYPASVLIFLALVLRAAWQSSRFDCLPILGLMLVLFLTFKGAFVLQDTYHQVQAALTTVPIACLYSALLWPDIRHFRWRLKRFRTAVPVVLAAWLSLSIYAHWIISQYAYVTVPDSPSDVAPPNYYWAAAANTVAKVGRAAQVISGQKDLQPIYDSSFERVRAENPIPSLSGTTDLYPNYTAVIFAHGLPYRPRPVIQSFSAYTGELARRNAAHLQSENAPENILFNIGTIFGRLPSSDDGLSWPTLLTRYQITDLTSEYLAMARRKDPGRYRLTPIAEVRSEVGEWIALPGEDDISGEQKPVWIRLEAQPTVLGKLMSALLKLPPLEIEVELTTGMTKRFRIFSDVIREGQLLSPLVEHRDDFVDLAIGRWQAPARNLAVRRLRLVTGGWGAIAYPHHYSVAFSSLDFPKQTLFDIPGWSDFQKLSLIQSGQVTGTDRLLERRDGKDGQPVLLAHADMRIAISLPAESQSLVVGYGVLDEAVKTAAMQAQAAVDGVTFRVLAVQPDGTEVVLLSDWVDPHENLGDRAEQKARLSLTDVSTRNIILETTSGPAQNSSWDWSYWSELTALRAYGTNATKG